eukprot:Clim_evm20s22 gene=Clim_evmTU20s22
MAGALNSLLRLLVFGVIAAAILFGIDAPPAVEPVKQSLKTAVESDNKADKTTMSPVNADDVRSVVVVGGGLAGLSATIEAYNTGNLKVTLVDKNKSIGGNSAKATSGMNAAGTEAQKTLNVTDSVEQFVEDTMKSGDNENNRKLVEVLAAESREAHKFIRDAGVFLDNPIQCGGHSAARTHREPNRADGKPSPVGWDMISALKKKIESFDQDRMTIVTNAAVKELITDPNTGQVVGIKYNNGEEIRADAVVLTTGGFGHDWSENSLLKEFAPHTVKMSTTNGDFASGDGVKMARKLGVSLVNMENVQVHPTGFVDPKDPNAATKFLGPEALRGSGGFMVNKKGQRFCNELGRRDYVTGEIFKHCDNLGDDGPCVSYLVMNEDCCDKFGRPNLGFYIFKGLLVQADNADDAAAKFGIDTAGLKKTIEEYTKDAAAGKDAFGKTVFPTKTFSADEKLTVAMVTPSVHYTMGGIKIDDEARVLKGDTAIPGFFAAGEVTGGVHGANRLAGNSLLECVVFGRRAGRNAAKAALASANL